MSPDDIFRTREYIEEVLRDRLDESRKLYLDVSRRFAEHVKEVPFPGLESSDGAQRIRNAAAERKTAFAQYEAAVIAFTRFVLEGEIPEDLKRGRKSGRQ